MTISQKQIAEKVGVSIALVSRVLSGKAAEIGIAEATIELVMKTAEEMGYVPSAAALALKGKSTQTIGVVVYDFKDPFFGAMIEQIQVQAHQHNYSLILTGFLKRIPSEQDLQPLRKHALDGLIIIGTDLNARWLDHFQQMPVARIGHGDPSEKSVRVSVDEKAAARLLIDHLAQTGRKKLLHISSDLPVLRLRRDAIQAAAVASGIALQTEQVSGETAFAAGMQAVTQQIPADIDALLCATDQMAMGALNALHQRKREIPQQIAVTGFDDIPAAEQFIPAITTIRQPIAAMARLAVNAIVQQQRPKEIVRTPELIIRQST